MFESVEPYSLALFTRVLGWDNPRVQELLEGVRADLKNLSYHMYSQMYVLLPFPFFSFSCWWFEMMVANVLGLWVGDRHLVCGMKPLDG